MKKNYSTLLFSTALVAAVSFTMPAAAQQTEYTDGVFMLNEGSFGTERATINYLDQSGKWHYRLPLRTATGTAQLGTTGCYATIADGNMYIVSKKLNLTKPNDDDATFTVCDAKTLEVKAQINNIATSGNVVTADGRAFLPLTDLKKGYLSTTNGVYVINLLTNEVASHIEGTDGIANNQTGNMVYANGKVFAVDKTRGILVIDTATDKLLKTINNEPEGGTYCSIVTAKDGSLWLTAGTAAGGTAKHLVKLNADTYETVNIALADDVFPPTNSWGAWNPDCFTASPNENVLYWNGATGAWASGQHIYKYDIDNNTTTLLVDYSNSTDEKKPYVYGAACRVNPYDGNLYISVTLGSAWGNESELRVIDTNNGQQKGAYPMEVNFWYPEMPVFALRSDATAISAISDAEGNITEVARYSIDGKRLQKPQPGLNIVRFSDGSVKKVMVR